MHIFINKPQIAISIFLMFIILLSSLPADLFSKDVVAAPPPDDGPVPFDFSGYGETNITIWQDNLPSALSITYDDSTPNQALIAAPEMTKRDLVGTFFMTIVDVSNWTWWQNVSNHGHELGSHTVNHVDLSAQSQANLEYQLRESKRFIEENVSGIRVDTICYPFGAYDSNVISTSEDLGYISGRRVWHLAYNPPEITWLFEVRPSYFNETTTPGTMNHYINRSIENNGWAVEMLHGIKDSGDGYEPIPVDNLAAHFNFVKQKKDEGTVWVDTFKNVSKYISERLNTTVNSTIDSQSGNITLNISTPLNTTVYDQHLTLQTKVPDNWTTVYIKHMNGTIMEYNPVFENGSTYVYYNIPHRNGTVRLTNSLTLARIQYAGGPGYTDSYFLPLYGDSQQDFIFRINVTSPEEIGLAGEPAIIFDVNGDGDTDDTVSGFVEGAYSMVNENIADTIYADGKIFNYSVKFPPGSVVKLRFDAIDQMGRNVSYPTNISLFISGPEINNRPYSVHTFNLEDNHTWTPKLTWDCVSDPDGDLLSYNISVGSFENISDIFNDASHSGKSVNITAKLEFNKMYYVSLQSIDARGLVSTHSYYNFTLVNNAPESPSDLAVVTNKTLTPTVHWNGSLDPDGDDVTYDLQGYYAEYNESGLQVNMSKIMFEGYDLSDKWFNVTPALPDNTTALVNLTSTDMFNTSSENVSAVFHFNIPPPRITDLLAKPGISDLLTVDLSWNFDHNNITDWRSYLIYRSELPFANLSTGAVKIAQLKSDKTANKFTDTGLTENITYYYAVITIDTTGDSFSTNLTNSSSKPSPEVPPELPPPPITGVAAKDAPNATNSINLSWEPSTAYNLEAYRIYRSLSLFTLLETNNILLNSYNRTLPTFYIDDTVENNVTYFYAVSAFSASGLENTTSFELVGAESLYDIKDDDDPPDDDIDIEIDEDTLYDSVINISYDVQSDLMDSITGSETASDDDSEIGSSDVSETAGEFFEQNGYGESGAVTDELIEIDAEWERITTNKTEVIDDAKPDVNKTDPEIKDDEPADEKSSKGSALESAILWAWFIVLIITCIVTLLYVLDKKRSGSEEEGNGQEYSEEFEEE